MWSLSAGCTATRAPIKHWYSAPFQLVSEEVEVRVSATTVEIFSRGKRVAAHRRDDTPYRHTTDRAHMPEAHRRMRDGTDSLLSWAASVAATCGEDLHVAASVAVIRRHEADGAVQVLVIVSVHEAPDPADRLIETGAALAGEAGAVLERAKERLAKGLSSLTWGRLNEGTMPSHCIVLSIDEPFIGLPLSECSAGQGGQGATADRARPTAPSM
jgi:hypothetical protein